LPAKAATHLVFPESGQNWDLMYVRFGALGGEMFVAPQREEMPQQA
jgi:hypothetical protein